MTVIAMSRTEIDRMSVLQDLAADRIKVADASTLMGLGRRQVFRLVKAFAQDGCAYRKSNPDILVVQSAENRAAMDASHSLDCARGRRILLQG